MGSGGNASVRVLVVAIFVVGDQTSAWARTSESSRVRLGGWLSVRVKQCIPSALDCVDEALEGVEEHHASFGVQRPNEHH